jgi:hypothetical protein
LETVEMRPIKSELVTYAAQDFRRRAGRALLRARSIVGWTQGELAWEVAQTLGRDTVDQAQVSRWELGKEGMPIAVLLAIKPLAWPLIRCLAELDEDNEVITRIQRRA